MVLKTLERRGPLHGYGIARQIEQTPLLDLQHAQGLLSFRIRTASWVPSGLRFVGVSMSPISPDFSRYEDRASVIYRPDGASGQTGPGVRIDERPGTSVGGSSVPSSAVRNVRVNGRPAVYVHGSYESAPGGPGIWNPKADDEELSWQADGITYNLTASGLGLTQSDMIRIASSIR